MMKKLQVKVTIVHYQYPAAFLDLRDWEQKFWPLVEFKKRIGNNVIFILNHQAASDKSQFFELVYCTPMPHQDEVLNEVILSIHSNMEREIVAFLETFFDVEKLWSVDCVWLKHIIYGSVNSDQLVWMTLFQNRFKAEILEWKMKYKKAP